MIDMHNHVLFGVDDGAQCVEDSLAMIKKAQDMGYTGMVLTPHYMVYQHFTSSVRENRTRFNQLKKAVADAGLTMELYLGSEILYEYQLVDLIGTDAFTTLGDSQWYLVETERQGGTALGIRNFMRKLRADGSKTIFAHPERYDFVQDDPNILMDFMGDGTLIQGNYLSLTGYYGQAAQHTMEELLAHDMVQLLGSDAHQVEGYELYPEAKEAGIALVGAEKWEELTQINPRKVILGEGDVVVAPKAYKPPIQKAVIGKFMI